MSYEVKDRNGQVLEVGDWVFYDNVEMEGYDGKQAEIVGFKSPEIVTLKFAHSAIVRNFQSKWMTKAEPSKSNEKKNFVVGDIVEFGECYDGKFSKGDQCRLLEVGETQGGGVRLCKVERLSDKRKTFVYDVRLKKITGAPVEIIRERVCSEADVEFGERIWFRENYGDFSKGTEVIVTRMPISPGGTIYFKTDDGRNGSAYPFRFEMIKKIGANLSVSPELKNPCKEVLPGMKVYYDLQVGCEVQYTGKEEHFKGMIGTVTKVIDQNAVQIAWKGVRNVKSKLPATQVAKTKDAPVRASRTDSRAGGWLYGGGSVTNDYMKD